MMVDQGFGDRSHSYRSWDSTNIGGQGIVDS